jgi:putative restriction endonuclease
VRDDDVRARCFAALDVLSAQLGEDLPYAGGLDRGFANVGRRVPFLNPQKGIHRARVQRGPAALSILTSYRSPYGDQVGEKGIVYAYRAGSIDQADNRALRAAHELGVPLVYFLATRPGLYRAFYPSFIVEDDPIARTVVVSFGRMAGPFDEREAVLVEDPMERQYVVREVRARMHQGRFRGAVLSAYREQCSICRLKESRLLDAAHIVGDTEPKGEPIVPNGVSLCSIHHRAFDQHLVGVSPDYDVRVSAQLLDDEDGPMLDLLKAFHGATLLVPSRTQLRPDRERLAERFESFVKSGGT